MWNYEADQAPEERVRDIMSQSDVPMTTGHYLRSMKQLTNQWTSTNFRDERRQRLYLKDIDCPPEWHVALQKIINPVLFYLNESVNDAGRELVMEDDRERLKKTAAPAGDLMSSLPREMRAENLMCYIGHEGTFTPAHREMCASLGQNIMVEASGNENGEKPGSSLWFMTESKDRAVVREYFLSMLGHDIEIEKHFAQVNAWKKAPFDVYIVEQKVGDFILIPPLAAHQVWNRGTRTMKVAWNRTTVETLELALQEALPKARLVCRDEQYKNKATIYYTLQSYYQRLKSIEDDTEKAQIDFVNLGLDTIRSSPRAKQLKADFKKLFMLFTQILVDEVFAFKEKNIEFLPFDSCITCSYCRANIFNRFLTCKNCVRTLVNGDEDTYDVCMECYAMGRSCVCISGLQWCEQWTWGELVNNHEIWRSMVIANDGFIDINSSPRPLEVARQLNGKKTVAQICQEALRQRPWKDITQPEKEPTPSDSDEVDAEKATKPKKSRRRKGRNGDARCHVCCHKELGYRVQMCTNPDCSEGYCFGVLYRAFDMIPQEVLQDEHWLCPKCLGICNCGHCRRSGNTQPYTPKNTSLGHDTRSVADDRSVESLVDFRLHNLAWLKSTGEKSRGQDTRRMQLLREQAHTAKSEGLSNEALEDENAENTNEASPGALRHHDLPREILGEGAVHRGQGGTSDEPNAMQNICRQQTELPVSVPWLHGEETVARLDEDSLAYPDPSVFAAQRIGMGYYEQDDTPDKILFDPYQAPAAEGVRDDESDIPEFVKKSIRSAKRKARKENEDPDFIVKSHTRKRPRPPRVADFLDSMDPALFDESSIATVSVPSQGKLPTTVESDSATQSTHVETKRKEQPRYGANEPLLRHAKPRASYVEDEDAEIEEVINTEQFDFRRSPAASELTPVQAKDNGGATTQSPSPGAASGQSIIGTAHTPFPMRETSIRPKKRGRPPGKFKKSVDTDTDEPTTLRSRPTTDNSSVIWRSGTHKVEVSVRQEQKEADRTGEVSNLPPQRRGPGRPRKSELIAHDTTRRQSTEADESEDTLEPAHKYGRPRRGQPRKSELISQDTTRRQSNEVDNESEVTSEPTLKDGRPRKGWPRKSDGSDPTFAKKPTAVDRSFMSLAERMALRGKKFKIGKRDRNSSPTEAAGISISDDYKTKPTGMTVQLAGFTAVNKLGTAPQAFGQERITSGSSTAQLRVGEFEDMTKFDSSVSNSGSSDDDDIPARVGAARDASHSIAMSSRGQRGRPRGRPSMRSRGRGRG